MGDYLRLVLKNRTNKNLDFGASEANLKQALGPRKKFLMKETLGNQDPVTYVFLETGSAPFRVEKKIRLPLALFFAGQPPEELCMLRLLSLSYSIVLILMTAL